MILVTGGTGLVGSRLLFDLTLKGEKVRAIKRSSGNLDPVKRIFSYYSPNPFDQFYNIEWVEADICNIESLLEAMHNVDYVYHAAAVVSFDPSEKEKLISNNVTGTRNVVNACLARGVKKLCYVSSTAALGPANKKGFIDENCMWVEDRLNSVYSQSKYYSELEVWKGIEGGLKAVIVNPSIILGPGFWDKGSSSMFSAVYRGLKFWSDGITGYVSLEDVTAAMIALMNSKKSGERYILSSENLSYREVFNMIAESLNVKKPSIEATPLMAEIALKIENLRCMLGAKRVLTRETVNASRNKSLFSNEKFTNEFMVHFQPIQPVISDIAEIFEKDKRDGWFDRKFRTWRKPA
jgi:dihydroflavonol-4-reductase